MNEASTSRRRYRRAYRFISGLTVLFYLAACGGGGSSDPGMQTSLAVPTGSSDPVANQVKTLAVSTLPDSSVNVEAAPSTNATTPLQYCKFMRLNSAYGCFVVGNGPTDVYPQTDGSSSAQGPVVSQCQTVALGQSLTVLSPPPGNDLPGGPYGCYQFLTTTPVTTTLQVNFPTGVTGIGELYFVSQNSGGLKQAGSSGSSNSISIPFTNQSSRMVLTVHTDNGAQGRPMTIGFGVPAPALVPNNSPSTATVAAMNQVFGGVVATPGIDQGYVFYPLRTGQTTAEISASFSANQTAGYRSAQLTGPNSYALGAESAIPSNQSGTVIAYSSPNPANAAGTTTPYGIMVRVSGANAAAPANEGYSVRVATRANAIYTASLTNTENISRWYPASGLLEVATSVTTNITVKDPNGSFLPGETVLIKVQANTGDPATIQTVQGVTDGNGSLSMTVPLAACSGAVQTSNNYGPPGSPTDHYNGTAQDGVVIQTLANTLNAPQTKMSFKRICSERYLGNY